jgi:hypothetical protein
MIQNAKDGNLTLLRESLQKGVKCELPNYIGVRSTHVGLL